MPQRSSHRSRSTRSTSHSSRTRSRSSGSKSRSSRSTSRSKGRGKIAKVMREHKHGTLKSGRSGKKVRSRKQAVAIALSEARKSGARIPKKRSRKS